MSVWMSRWLAVAAEVLEQRLSSAVHLLPGGGLSAGVEAVGWTVEVAGDWEGSFIVVTDRAGLAELAALAGGSGEGETGADEWWRPLFQEICASTAKRISETSGAACDIVRTSRGGPPQLTGSFAYQVRAKDRTANLVVIDRVIAKGAEAAPREQAKQRGLELLLDVELEASLRFGSRELTMNDLLELGPGDVVQLDRHVADPVDLIVGDKIVARGEVVLVGGNFGLQVTQVAEPRKSLESIRCLF